MNGTISRYLVVMAACVVLAAAGARAEDVDVYTVPPVYTDAMQLADAVHLAELVVAGRLEVGGADSARLVVDEVGTTTTACSTVACARGGSTASRRAT